MSDRPISLFDLMEPVPEAPCFLDKRETSGDPENWPGSPCYIEDELCWTCSAMTARGKRMQWRNGRPIPGTEE